MKDYDYMPDVCKKCEKKKNCKYTLHDGKMDCSDWMKWLKLHWGAIHNDADKMYGRKK